MKNYQKPEIELVKLETKTHLTIASDTTKGVEGTADFRRNMNGNNTTDEAMSKGRGFNMWDYVE